MHFTIRQGYDVKVDGPPRQVVEDGPLVSSVALCGADFRGVRPKILVQADQAVAQGEVLFVDRHRPEVAFAAPVSGVIERIDRSTRGTFDYIVIRRDGDRTRTFDASGDVREVLLASGMWPSLIARPFGRIPDPDATPDAILVTAMDTSPLAAEPAVVISEALEEFQEGLQRLARLTAGQVFVCQAPGDPLIAAEQEHIHCVRFRGKHPAGLPGTHLDRLGLAGRPVWQIGYQAVISIGRLFRSGRPASDRVISIAGPAAGNPRLVRTVQGANLQELSAGATGGGGVRMISGSVLSGRTSSYLGFYHDQLCLLPEPPRKRGFPPGLRGYAGAAAPLLPSEAYERALSQDILPVPLMRALSVGDDETAENLGATDLLEEDVALLSYLCPSGNDYGALLRQTLDRIEAAR